MGENHLFKIIAEESVKEEQTESEWIKTNRIKCLLCQTIVHKNCWEDHIEGKKHKRWKQFHPKGKPEFKCIYKNIKNPKSLQILDEEYELLHCVKPKTMTTENGSIFGRKSTFPYVINHETKFDTPPFKDLTDDEIEESILNQKLMESYSDVLTPNQKQKVGSLMKQGKEEIKEENGQIQNMNSIKSKWQRFQMEEKFLEQQEEIQKNFLLDLSSEKNIKQKQQDEDYYFSLQDDILSEIEEIEEDDDAFSEEQ